MSYAPEYLEALQRFRNQNRRKRLLGERVPRRTELLIYLRKMGWDGPELNAKILDELGPETDEERALSDRILRENHILSRAMLSLLGDKNGSRYEMARAECRLCQHIQKHFLRDRGRTVYAHDLSEEELAVLERWVAQREARAARRRDADL